MCSKDLYTDLRGLIRSEYKTQANFAEAIGISACSMSKKLNGKAEWTAEEIRKACEVLGISAEQIPTYFFTLIVEKSQQKERKAPWQLLQ